MSELEKLAERRTERRSELRAVAALIFVAAPFYALAYTSVLNILLNIQHIPSNIQHHNNYAPTEAIQIISAAGGLAIAVSTSVAAIIKLCNMFARTHLESIRARNEAAQYRNNSPRQTATRKKGSKSLSR